MPEWNKMMPEHDNSMPMQVGRLIATMESATIAISALTARLDAYEENHRTRWEEFIEFRSDTKAAIEAKEKADAKEKAEAKEARSYLVKEARSSEAGEREAGDPYWVKMAKGMPKPFWWLIAWLATLAMTIIWASGQLPNLVQIYAEHYSHKPDIIIQRPEPVPSASPK